MQGKIELVGAICKVDTQLEWCGLYVFWPQYGKIFQNKQRHRCDSYMDTTIKKHIFYGVDTSIW